MPPSPISHNPISPTPIAPRPATHRGPGHLLLATLLLVAGHPAHAQSPPPVATPGAPSEKHVASLRDVTAAITAILAEVRSDPAVAAGPQLRSAEFDFQTVSSTTATGGLGILGVLTTGASRDRTSTSEVDFTYQVPSTPASPAGSFSPNFGGGWFGKVRDFFRGNDTRQILANANTVLPAAIKAAALDLALTPALANPSGPDLTHRSFVVTLAFTVTDAFVASGDLSSLLVVGPRLAGDRSVSTVQTLKLSFEDPPAPHASAARNRSVKPR